MSNLFCSYCCLVHLLIFSFLSYLFTEIYLLDIHIHKKKRNKNWIKSNNDTRSSDVGDCCSTARVVKHGNQKFR